MSSSIILATPDGKRYPLKVTPMMPLKSILEQACLKFELGDFQRWQLCNTKKVPLDLSLTVRFANLPAGSKLLVLPKASNRLNPEREDTTVEVALQLPEGGRVMGSFKNSTLIWKILEHFETESNGTLNLTKRTDQKSSNLFDRLKESIKEPEYMIPALLIMNRELNNLKDLKSSTLETLGIESRVLIRLVFKHSGKTLTQIENEQISLNSPISSNTEPTTIKPSEAVSRSSQIMDNEYSSLEKIPDENNMNAPSLTLTSLQEDSRNELEIDREFILYAPPTENSILNVQLADDFFELSSTELKAYAAWMTKRRTDLENRPLKTSSMREKEEIVKRSKFPKTLIRIKFHDLHQLQFRMLSYEPVEILYQLVQSKLLTPPPDFQLFQMVPRKQPLPRQGNIYEAGLAPAAILYCTISNRLTPDWIVPELVQSIKTLPVAETPTEHVQSKNVGVTVSTESTHPIIVENMESYSTTSTSLEQDIDDSQESPSKTPTTIRNKLSKFIRLGKKNN